MQDEDFSLNLALKYVKLS